MGAMSKREIDRMYRTLKTMEKPRGLQPEAAQRTRRAPWPTAGMPCSAPASGACAPGNWSCRRDPSPTPEG